MKAKENREPETSGLLSPGPGYDVLPCRNRADEHRAVERLTGDEVGDLRSLRCVRHAQQPDPSKVRDPEARASSTGPEPVRNIP